jgi:hypothetical protein
MPRVTHVKKARKNVPGTDIKKGESYYWWKFRYGGKHAQRTPPKQSQLTQSSFLSTLYSIQERIEELSDNDSLEGEVEEIKGELESLKDECESSLENMPEQLQESPTGEMLQSRIDAMEDAISEFEDFDLSYEEPTDESIIEDLEEEWMEAWGEFPKDKKKKLIDEYKEAKEQEFWSEKLDEVQAVEISEGDC